MDSQMLSNLELGGSGLLKCLVQHACALYCYVQEEDSLSLLFLFLRIMSQLSLTRAYHSKSTFDN